MQSGVQAEPVAAHFAFLPSGRRRGNAMSLLFPQWPCGLSRAVSVVAAGWREAAAPARCRIPQAWSGSSPGAAPSLESAG